MKTAIISIEDYRFYEHGAIDIEGTIRALAKNLRSGGVSQGGSSITQQYVKQVLLNSADTEEEKNAALEASYARKLNELRYAMAIEKKYTKDQILEKYLNIAYFGAGAYGVEAAAKRFFGVHGGRAHPGAGGDAGGRRAGPQHAPTPTWARSSRERLLDRRNVVLDRMAELEQDHPGRRPPRPRPRSSATRAPQLPGGCEASKYPYFCLYVRNEILNNPDFGKTAEGAPEAPQPRRPDDQDHDRPEDAGGRRARRSRSTCTPPTTRSPSEALVEPGTGAIKAMAASRQVRPRARRKNEISYNVVADAAHGGGTGFQAGLDVQDLHPDHRPEGGHEDQRRLHRRAPATARPATPRSRTARARTSATRPTPSPTTRASRRLQDAADRHLGLGEHLLHDAGAAGRPLRHGQDGQVAGHQARRRAARCRSSRRSRSASTRWTR